MSKKLHTVEALEEQYEVLDLHAPFTFDKPKRIGYYWDLGAARDAIWRYVKQYSYGVHAVNLHEITFYDLIAEDAKKKPHDWKTYLPEKNKYFWERRKYIVKQDSRSFLVRRRDGSIVSVKEIINAPKFKPAPYISKWDSEAYKEREKREQHCLSKRVHKKNNVNKIKGAVSAEVDHEDGTYREGYYNYHRRIKTNQERRINVGHDNEYRDEFKFGRSARKGHNLPSSWDDLSVSTWSSRKSWKTNSKRRKQWKQRDEMSL